MNKALLFSLFLAIISVMGNRANAQDLQLDPLCGEVEHAPCVPGFNAPFPEKKTFEYRFIDQESSNIALAPIQVLAPGFFVELRDSVDFPIEIIAKRLPYSELQTSSNTYQAERTLILRAYEDPDLIGSLSEDVFEVALKRNGVPLASLKAPITITLPWPGETYMKKVIHVWDGIKREWIPIPSESNFENKTVSASWPLPYGQFAVFDTSNVFEGVASWYAYKGCSCAAIKEYKRGTKFRVTNITDGSPRYGRYVNVTINDYGPAVWTKRVIDLDKTAFRQIASPWNGLAVVRVERIID